MHRLSVAVGLVVCFTAFACARPTPPPVPIVLGPYDFTAGGQLVDEVAVSMTEAGYEPTTVRPDEGRLEASLRTRWRGSERPPIIVQLYREGWVLVTSPIPDISLTVFALRARSEVEALALAISERLRARLAPAEGLR